MPINSLSYIGVNSDKIEDWSEFSQKCLGMQQVDRAKGALSFRMDDHKQRLAILVILVTIWHLWVGKLKLKMTLNFMQIS